MQKVRKKQKIKADKLCRDRDIRNFKDFRQFTDDLPTQKDIQEIRQQWLDSKSGEEA